MFGKGWRLLLSFLLSIILVLSSPIVSFAEGINKNNSRVMVWFNYPEVSVLTVDFSTGESKVETYKFTKPLEQLVDGETIQGTLDNVKLNTKRFPNTIGSNGYSITYKDKNNKLKSTTIEGNKIVLTFDHTNKTMTRQKTYNDAALLDKNYTYKVLGDKDRGIYSIFNNQKLGYDYFHTSSYYPSYYDKFSLPLTPWDYVITSAETNSLININQKGIISPVKQVSKDNDSFTTYITNEIVVKGVKADNQVNYYRIEGKNKTLLNKNYTGSSIQFSLNKKYAFVVEAIPPKDKWSNPEKVIFSFYDLLNNKLIKSFQAPARKYVSPLHAEWYSDELVRLSFGSSLRHYKDIFYLHLPTGVMTYQGSERESARDVPPERVQNLSYFSGDTKKLITMQDPFYVTVDGEYLKYSGQGTFVYNDLVYIPIEDFCKTAGVTVTHEMDKLILSKDSKSTIIDTKDSRVITAYGQVFAPAIDFIESLGFKDELGTYQKDLDIISFR